VILLAIDPRQAVRGCRHERFTGDTRGGHSWVNID
jgi:hypothetical protein